MVSRLLIRYRRVWLAGFHLVLFALAYGMSFALRFDFQINEPYRAVLVRTLPLVLLVKLAVFSWFGLFRGWWKYVGMSDVFDIGWATAVASLLAFGALFAVFGLTNFPRGVLVLDLALTFLFVGGVRFLVRAYTESFRSSGANVPVKTVLVVGAGTTGTHLVREMRSNERLNYEPAGFVDDDSTKQGLKIQGLRVLGTSERIPDLVRRLDISEVLIAIPSASGKQMRAITEICRKAGVKFKTMPAVGDLIGGRVSVSHLREVQIEDLLGRDPVRLDQALVRQNLAGTRVLVTGAAGSIGSELARQIAGLKPDHLVVLDRAESELHALHLELQRSYPRVQITHVIGDILDADGIDELFGACQPNRVYHAAAYKHVPIMERHVVAVVRHNVLGTANVARAAVAHGTEQFVLISSDKAVRPTSLMGATKRAAEGVVLAMNGGTTRFVAVRFGNVLGSRGSVVPLFKEQIARGGPVTVTHPDVVRYFMTIPEAVQLVLQASAMGRGGEVFHLEMGDPVRIVDLAENLIRLSGLQPGKDVEIAFTGLRPGEKLYEELLVDGHDVQRTAHEKIWVNRANGSSPIEHAGWLASVEEASRQRDAAALLALICEAVPEYTPSPQARSATLGAVQAV